MADETLNELRQALDDAVLTRTGRSIGDLASQHVLDDIMPYITALRSPQPADEPRAIVRAFALAMERKLAANDEVKGGWRIATKRADMMRWKALRHLTALRNEIGELEQAVIAMDSLRREPNAEQVHDILMEAADVANYAMLIADVCGALPPTDERGR